MLKRLGQVYCRFMTLDWLIERGVPQESIIALLALGGSVYTGILAFRALVLHIPAQGYSGNWLTGSALIANGIACALVSVALLGSSGFFLRRGNAQRPRNSESSHK